MNPAFHTFRHALALAMTFAVASGLVLAADKKDEKKADEKNKPDTKKAVDPKAAEKLTTHPTNAVPLVVSFPKASFSTALETGKDPFFPNSKRRFPKAPVPPPIFNTNKPPLIVGPVAQTNLPPVGVTNPPPVAPPIDLIGSANLSLRGITVTKTRRIAEVNTGVKGYTMLKGDTILVRLPKDQELKIRCVDIRERSAIFQVEGETQTKELFLREGL